MSAQARGNKKSLPGKLLFKAGSDTYRRRNNRVYKHSAGQKALVCGMLRFVELLEDIDDRSVFVKITFSKGHDQHAEVLAPMAQLMDRFPVRDLLLNRGFEIFDRHAFKEFLPRYWDSCRPTKSAKVTRNPGWHQLEDGGYYAAPEWTAAPVKEDDDNLRLLPNSGSAIAVRGTVDEWNEAIGSKCQGNPRLIFAVCAALTAPVLRLVDKPNIGVGFIGNSSQGKTTALQVAASVFGSPAEYFDTWNATDNALNAMALARLDSPLIVDELAECDPRVMATACYELLNGRGRRRLDRGLELNQKLPYRGVVQFSGELSILELLHEGGIRAREGQAVRLLTIPLPAAGMFADIHDETDPAAFADSLKRASGNCYGAVGRRWIRFLARDADGIAGKILKTATASTGELREGLAEGIPSNVLSRVVDSFAVIAAVGEIAIAKEVVAWSKGDAIKGAKVCVKAWAKYYAVERAEMVEDPLIRVRRFFQSESEGKFVPFNEYDGVKRKDLAGFMHQLADGTPVYLVYPAYFEERFCAKGGKKVLIAALKKHDFLVCDSAGRPVKQIRIKRDPQGRKPGFYVIRRSIIEN